MYWCLIKLGDYIYILLKEAGSHLESAVDVAELAGGDLVGADEGIAVLPLVREVRQEPAQSHQQGEEGQSR